MSYKKLQIRQMAKELVIDIHKISLNQLPKFEVYEQGGQIRRSMKSVKANIVEGYGRRRYKMDYLRYLTYELASNDETIDHWETLFETASLENSQVYQDVHSRLEILGKKINLFIQSVERNHKTYPVKEEDNSETIPHLQEPSIHYQYPASRNQDHQFHLAKLRKIKYPAYD